MKLLVSGRDPLELSRYGIVFPSAPDRKDWSRFWTALSQETSGLQNATIISI